MGRTIFFRIFAFLIVALGFLPAARAHQVPSVELEFQNLEPEKPVWRLLGEMDIAYMLPETRTIPNGPPLSRAAVMGYPSEEFARIRSETDNTLHKLIRITFAGKEVEWTTEFPDFEKEPFQLPPEAGDIALLSVRLTMPAQEGSGKLEAHWSGEQETELIILIGDDEDYGNIISCLPGESLTLLQQTKAAGEEPVKQEVKQRLGGGFLNLGFHHVMGPDHILFILGLFLLLPKWKPLMKQSLLFTLAHSITLALAIFGLMHVSGVWVEHLIAISIAWVGIENLCVKKLGPWRMGLVFGFGLLHGLGFATVLAEKLKNVPRDRLLLPLLSFNAGVELAQIAILAVAFAFLWPIRQHTAQVRTIGSAIIALAGIGWAVQRLFFM